jgi:hypothetical protein
MRACARAYARVRAYHAVCGIVGEAPGLCLPLLCSCIGQRRRAPLRAFVLPSRSTELEGLAWRAASFPVLLLSDFSDDAGSRHSRNADDRR